MISRPAFEHRAGVRTAGGLLPATAGVSTASEFTTREKAEAAVDQYEREDEEAEREARDQDEDRGDCDFHRDHDR